MQRISVTRGLDPLEHEVWTFWYDERRHALVLDSYVRERRPSKRHTKWQPIESYERVGRRRYEPQANPPLPADVSVEAAKQFTDSLKVEINL